VVFAEASGLERPFVPAGSPAIQVEAGIVNTLFLRQQFALERISSVVESESYISAVGAGRLSGSIAA
jgi:hypothetical protein